jgi:hypothetical protein
MATPLHARADTADMAEDGDDATAEKAPQAVQTAQEMHWQFGIALNVLAYQRASFDVTPINSGQSLPGTLDRTNIGPSGSSVLLEPGYVFGNRLVLGMLLDVGNGVNELRVKRLSFHVTQSAASFAVGPRLAYLFAPDSTLRPFATLAFGYTTTPSKAAAQTLRITEYQAFAGAGLAYFVVPSFSFDTSVRVAYGIGSGYVDSPPLENANLSGSVFTLMWTLGTSGWLR